MKSLTWYVAHNGIEKLSNREIEQFNAISQTIFRR